MNKKETEAFDLAFIKILHNKRKILSKSKDKKDKTNYVWVPLVDVIAPLSKFVGEIKKMNAKKTKKRSRK